MSEYNSPDTRLMLTLCLEEGSILLDEGILETLGHPKQVQMLINEEQQKLLLRSCTVEERGAVVIPPMTTEQFEMSGYTLLKRIRKLTGWTDNRSRMVFGQYVPSHDAIAFDLHDAQISPVEMTFDDDPGQLH